VKLRLELHERQSDAFLSDATEILYGGAAGGGKSHLLRSAAIAWCFDIPGLQVYLFRRTSPDLLSNHMEGPSGFPAMLAEWIEAGFVKINYSKGFIGFGNGSKIFLRHCQYEKDVYNYQGAEIHVLMMDELTHFSKAQYAFLRSRVRLGGLNLPDRYRGRFPRIIGASNPGGVGHNWVKMTFVDSAPPMAVHQTDAEDGGMRRQFIPALLEDNPTLLENDPAYEQRLEGMGSPALVRAMRTGDWDIVAGGMFDDVWDRTKHAIHAFPIPASWRIDRAFDWGSSKPFSVGWWAESDGTPAPNGRVFPRGSLVRIAEWYGWDGKNPNVGVRMPDVDIARGIVAHEKRMGIHGRVKAGPADSAIFSGNPGTRTTGEIMRSEGVHFTESDKRPGSRANGWEALRRMLTAAMQERPEEPGLWVFDTCSQFIRTIPTLPRDERKPDDIDTDAEDHIADETRYRVTAPKHTASTFEFRV
jgi:hypothetical protein